MRKSSKRLRNWPKGHHEWLKVSKADVFKSWGVDFDTINKLRTPTKDVKFIDNEGNIGSHHGSHAGSWAHSEIDTLIDNSSSFDDFSHKLAIWADDHVVGGRDTLPDFFKNK